MRSDAQRRADAAYRERKKAEIKASQKIITCNVPAELAEKFSAVCAKKGVSKNSVLRASIEKFVDEN